MRETLASSVLECYPDVASETRRRCCSVKSLSELSNDIANVNFAHAMRAHHWLRIHSCKARFYLLLKVLEH